MNACIISIHFAARQLLRSQAVNPGNVQGIGTRNLDRTARLPPPYATRDGVGASDAQADRWIDTVARSATILRVASAYNGNQPISADDASAGQEVGPHALRGRSWWRVAVLAVSLAVAGAAVFMALHPIVLARPSSVSQMTATLDGWQSAFLLSLPGPDRRAGHASAELVRRLDHHAAMQLREIGTPAFAERQAAERRAAPGIIVRSSHQIVDVRVVHRFWDGDLLVEANVLSTVARAAYDAPTGTWHSFTTTATVTPVQARVRDMLGVWRIESVEN